MTNQKVYSDNQMPRAGIAYTRVSTKEQAEGFSLAAQKDACQSYAKKLGFKIKKTFTDPGVSGKSLERPGLLALLEYCRNHREISFVVCYKLDRISRQTSDYLIVRQKLAKHGIELLSATEPTGDSPAEKFVETVIASMAEFENSLRAERVSSGMRKRHEMGLHNGICRIGYEVKEVGGKKMAVPDPDTFDKVKDAWLVMATGTKSLSDMTKFMADLRTTRGGKIRTQTLSRLFRDRFYIGILDSPKYGESQGVHTPMISKETFYKVQKALDSRNHKPISNKWVRTSKTFPLRKHFVCGMCGSAFTGSFSKSRSGKKYSYYHCSNTKCRARNIPTDEMESYLMDYLRTLQPTDDFFKKFSLLLKADYQEEYQQISQTKKLAAKDIEILEEQLVRAAKKNLEGRYSDEVHDQIKADLENQKLVKEIVLNEAIMEKYDIDTMLDWLEELLGDLGRAWEIASPGRQRLLLGSIFEEKPIWNYPGISNPKIRPIWRAFQANSLQPISTSEPGRNWIEPVLSDLQNIFTGFQPNYQFAYQ